MGVVGRALQTTVRALVYADKEPCQGLEQGRPMFSTAPCCRREDGPEGPEQAMWGWRGGSWSFSGESPGSEMGEGLPGTSDSVSAGLQLRRRPLAFTACEELSSAPVAQFLGAATGLGRQRMPSSISSPSS